MHEIISVDECICSSNFNRLTFEYFGLAANASAFCCWVAMVNVGQAALQRAVTHVAKTITSWKKSTGTASLAGTKSRRRRCAVQQRESHCPAQLALSAHGCSRRRNRRRCACLSKAECGAVQLLCHLHFPGESMAALYTALSCRLSAAETFFTVVRRFRLQARPSVPRLLHSVNLLTYYIRQRSR